MTLPDGTEYLRRPCNRVPFSVQLRHINYLGMSPFSNYSQYCLVISPRHKAAVRSGGAINYSGGKALRTSDSLIKLIIVYGAWTGYVSTWKIEEPSVKTQQ